MATGTGPNLATTPRQVTTLSSTTPVTTLSAVSIPTTGVVAIFTAAANGSRINQIRINQVTTTAAPGCLNILIGTSSTASLFDFYQYSAITLSATSQAIPIDIPYQQLVLPSTAVLYITDTANAAAAVHFAVTVLGGDF
jgi:hypothetical protein